MENDKNRTKLKLVLETAIVKGFFAVDRNDGANVCANWILVRERKIRKKIIDLLCNLHCRE